MSKKPTKDRVGPGTCHLQAIVLTLTILLRGREGRSSGALLLRIVVGSQAPEEMIEGWFLACLTRFSLTSDYPYTSGSR